MTPAAARKPIVRALVPAIGFMVVILAGAPAARGQAPSVAACDSLSGAAFGLCTAFCEAMQCASGSPHATQQACDRIEGRFLQVTGALPPCKLPLTYFGTCGDPVCRGWTPTGVPLCTTEMVGDACSTAGSTCDPRDPCNSLIVCSNIDPTQGGCPISRREAKRDIQYLDEEKIHHLHDELLKFRLATYRYKAPGASGTTRLGFIIDDLEPSPAIHSSGDMVDLYGYTSMAVAALQLQARQIRALKEELEALRRHVEQLKGPTPSPTR